jgi:hypothetical protein
MSSCCGARSGRSDLAGDLSARSAVARPAAVVRSTIAVREISVPAATPVPRGPSVLSLYSVADLLMAPGCPICRYLTEASDRYLGWFALEGHSQPELITSLCASLGACARHTRGLMSQPGAAVRLTAVYRYVLSGIRDRLADRNLSLAQCPACKHDEAAAERALDTLLEGLSDTGALRQCGELGGVCLPHLQAAAQRGTRQIVISLADTMANVLAAGRPGDGWVAGTDYDAEIRVRLRQTTTASSGLANGLCIACLAAAQAERDSLADVAGLTGGNSDGAGNGRALCGGHLADSMVMTGSGQRRALLERQLASLAVGWQSPADAVHARRANWRRRRALRSGSRDCAVCQDSGNSALQALSSACIAEPAASRQAPILCLRHQATLWKANRHTGRALSHDSLGVADELIRELISAFEMTTHAGRRDGVRRPESTAWRRAAAFLDGGVFAGLFS